MKLLNLKDMADGKIPVPVGKMVNIRSVAEDGKNDEGAPAVFRKLISVEWRKAKKNDKDQSRWLYWTWESDGTMPSYDRSIMDCGYSGRMEHAFEDGRIFLALQDSV